MSCLLLMTYVLLRHSTMLAAMALLTIERRRMVEPPSSGWTELVSRITLQSNSGSMTMPVPVKPVWQ